MSNKEDNQDLKRIAIFVEGQTEQMFVTKLFEEVLAKEKLAICNTKMTGGNKSPISISTIRAEVPNESTKYYILIVDCSGDSTVKTYSLDQRNSLIKKGYLVIVGLLDLYPKVKTDLHAFKYGLHFKVPQTPIETKFVVSVEEIEAWFLAEISHFINIDNSLDETALTSVLGYNPGTINIEDVNNPASELHKVYASVGKQYQKKRDEVQETVDALDYGEMYFSLPEDIDSLKEFIELVNKYI